MMKYDRYENNAFKEQYKANQTIEHFVEPGEIILYKSKPKKSSFVLNSSMALFPIALIWLLFDGFIISIIASQFISIVEDMGGFPIIIFFVLFFAIHLMPVWMWIGKTITASRRWKNTEYAITDRRIIVKNGLAGINYQSIFFGEISHINVHIGFIDRLTKVGDVIPQNIAGSNIGAILDVAEPYKVYDILQRAVSEAKHSENATHEESCGDELFGDLNYERKRDF